MEASALTTVASMGTSARNGDRVLVAISGPFPLRRKRSATGSFRLRRRFERLAVLASKEEEPRLNQWDQMELKFGRMLGEDPKLTMAKVTFLSLVFVGNYSSVWVDAFNNQITRLAVVRMIANEREVAFIVVFRILFL